MFRPKNVYRNKRNIRTHVFMTTRKKKKRPSQICSALSANLWWKIFLAESGDYAQQRDGTGKPVGDLFDVLYLWLLLIFFFFLSIHRPLSKRILLGIINSEPPRLYLRKEPSMCRERARVNKLCILRTSVTLVHYGVCECI